MYVYTNLCQNTVTAGMELPVYPGAQAQEVLASSQIATLNKTIASALSLALAIPQDKRDKRSSIAFISSYAKDHAKRILHTLIKKPIVCFVAVSLPLLRKSQLRTIRLQLYCSDLRLIELSLHECNAAIMLSTHFRAWPFFDALGNCV